MTIVLSKDKESSDEESGEDNDTTGSQGDQTPTRNSGEQALDEEESRKYVWKLEGFSKLPEKHFSSIIDLDKHKWQLTLFPRGYQVDAISMYLKLLDKGYTRKEVKFRFEVINQLDPKKRHSRDATHDYTPKQCDWGFSQLISLKDLNDPANGYLVDDTVIIEVYTQVLSTMTFYDTNYQSNTNYSSLTSSWNYDSKKETGFVGLKNQGATCYMNSLLQALFHLGSFRKAVYQMPTEKELENPDKCSIPLALQRLFYRMQFADRTPSTKELTTSFGWTSAEAFTQHDVQELNRVLCDNLETKMKGTPVEGTIERLFRAKSKTYIKCINVEYESSRLEDYYDLSIDVKGCRDLYASFDKYIEVEMLDGENKYQAEGHGKQDAKKGCIFHSFPPVLFLQLKRFEYDPYRDAMVKVNDKFVFYPELDLTRYVAEEGQHEPPSKYHLFAVLVHSGGVHGGHYYAFIRPRPGSEWFKFDDSRVTKVTPESAIDDNFGGEQTHTYNYQGRSFSSSYQKFSNAYLLVYVRDAEATEILAPVQEDVIPTHIKQKFEEERQEEEGRKKEKAEEHLYLELKIITEADIRQNPPTQFDLVDKKNEKFFTTKIRKDATLGALHTLVEKQFGIAKDKHRLWRFVTRENGTFRPQHFLGTNENEHIFNNTYDKLWTVFVEQPNADDLKPNDDNILLFFKHYDPESELLEFVGHRVLPKQTTTEELSALCCSMSGCTPDQTLLLFEEVKPTNVQALKPQQSLELQELRNGDIVVFQKPANHSHACETAPLFYTYTQNRISVDFYPLAKPTEKSFTLDLSKNMDYVGVSKKVAEALKLDDPLKLRFTGYNSFYEKPRQMCFKYTPTMLLHQMLVMGHNPLSPILYYEPLSIPLPDLESKKILKVIWQNSKNEVTETFSVMVPKDARADGLYQKLAEVAPVESVSQLRIFEVYNNKVYKVLSPDSSISFYDEYTKLYAEAKSAEEAEMKDGDQLVNVSHMTRDGSITRYFGTPFVMFIKAGETVGSLRKRIQQKLEVPDEEFAKWNLLMLSYTTTNYDRLMDSEEITKDYFRSPNSLGLEHKDTTPVTQPRARRSEAPIKIYN